MKLKAVHCYQYVRFQNKNENFLTAKEGMQDIDIELLSSGVVSVKSAKDHIVIWPTNIAYGIPLSKDNEPVKLPNRGALLENEPGGSKKKF
jgi:hypothetical protein